jgi:hypothetical protein
VTKCYAYGGLKDNIRVSSKFRRDHFDSRIKAGLFLSELVKRELDVTLKYRLYIGFLVPTHNNQASALSNPDSSKHHDKFCLVQYVDI